MECSVLLHEILRLFSGKGEGKMSIAARPEFNDHVLVIEDYATQPVMLNNVQKVQ